MIFAKRTFLEFMQGLSILRMPREEPVTPEERQTIQGAIDAYFAGAEPIRVRACGNNYAGTRKARNVIQETDKDTHKISYRYEERPVVPRDVVIGKLCLVNDHGFDHDPETLEPFVPEVRIAFADGSVAVMQVTSPATPAGEGSQGQSNDGQGDDGKQKTKDKK